MQLILAALAAVACIFLGMMAANRLSEREKLLNSWEEILQRLEMEIERGGGPLPQMLRNSAQGTGVCLEAAAEILEKEPALTGEKWLSQIQFEPLLTPAEQETLAHFLKGLFAAHRDEQLQALYFAREQWSMFRRVSREARENNARLYSSLGWLAGAAVFILIC